jgi:hypothetical protein
MKTTKRKEKKRKRFSRGLRYITELDRSGN